MKKYLAILLTVALLFSVAGTALAATATPAGNGTVTISGTVTGAGQQVTVLVVEDNTNIASIRATDIVYMVQTASDGNGAYSVSFIMPTEKRNGTYDVYIGTTEAGAPAATDLTYPTEAPTEAPTAAPTAAPAATPEVDMGNVKPAANGSNAFYYVISIVVNDGNVTGFNVKHYPSDLTEEDATTSNFNIENISGTTIKVISALKDIPDGQENRSITSKATLTYTIGGNAGTPIIDTRETTLNQTRPNN